MVCPSDRARRGVFFIGDRPYTGYVDYDRETLRQHKEDWIPWLEERLQVILIRPLDRVLHRDAPDHQRLHGDNMSLALGLLTLILCAVEALGALMCGRKSNKGRKKKSRMKKNAMFGKWIDKYMPDWRDGKLKDWLYSKARCGMAHALGIENGGIEVDLRQKHTTDDKGNIVINHYPFYEDFREGAARFFDDLRKSRVAEDELWKSFEDRFEGTFLPRQSRSPAR